MMSSLWAARWSLLFAVCKIGRRSSPRTGKSLLRVMNPFLLLSIYPSCVELTILVMNLLLWWTYFSCGETTPLMNLLLWWIYFSGEPAPLVMKLLLWWTYFSCGESTPVMNLLLWWIYFSGEHTLLVMNLLVVNLLLLWWIYSCD
jgi:hypothetical protein